MKARDIRHLRRMKFAIADARANRISLVDAANSLLFLRNAMEVIDPPWSDRFTSHIATLESAGTASLQQRTAMGQSYDAMIATTLDELEKMVESIEVGGVDVE